MRFVRSGTLEEIRQSAELAKRYGCVAVFALPAHTPHLIDLLADSTVKDRCRSGLDGVQGQEDARLALCLV